MEGFDELIDYIPLMLEGSVVTLTVAFVSLGIALVLGLITASLKLSGSRLGRGVAGVYTTVIRGVPDLVLMLLIFFGGQIQVNNIGAYFGWDYIDVDAFRSEEHTSELQSLMRISYAVFCLKKKKNI